VPDSWCRHRGTELKIVDLPGTYSLTARAVDELIARNYIVEEKPDVVVDIVDASNIERNLYLTFLLIELEANVVVALNMFDIAQRLQNQREEAFGAIRFTRDSNHSDQEKRYGEA